MKPIDQTLEVATLRSIVHELTGEIRDLRRELAVAELQLGRAYDDIEGLLDQIVPSTRSRHLAVAA